VKIQLNTKIFKQNPSLSYCSPNAIKTVIHYYRGTSPSRQTLFKDCKARPKTGTLIKNSLKTDIPIRIPAIIDKGNISSIKLSQ